MEELIKLDAYPIRGLVGRLLQDKTTRKIYCSHRTVMLATVPDTEMIRR